MEFFRVYGRVIGLLRAERKLAIALALANVAVAALQFYEPVLFGKVVDLLSTAKDKPVDVLWHDASRLLILWAAVGVGGIVREPELHKEVVDTITAWLGTQPGWTVLGVVDSPITGADGNREFLIAAHLSS